MNSHDANEAAFIQPRLLVALARHVALNLNAQVSGLERGKSCAPNLANSRGYSVKEVITVAEKVCGRSIPLETASRRSGDPADSNRGDAGQARRLLSWKPMHSDLETPRNHNRVLSAADAAARLHATG
jgi:UDP-glucose 4-epimerase